MPSQKILIVEDEKPLSRALYLKLQAEGFQCTAVNDGDTALEELESDGFGMVVLDLVMPKVDGFDVLEKMRDRGDKTPVVVVSNLSQEEDMVRAKNLGALAYFVKSDVQLSDIVEKIKEYLKNG